MAIRVSRQRTEALTLQTPNARVSRQRVEALIEENPNLRISRQLVEVLHEETPNLRTSRQYVEILGFREFNARVSRQHVELLGEDDPGLAVSRQFVEVLHVGTPNLYMSRQIVEVLAPVLIYFVAGSSVLILQQSLSVATNHITVEYYGTIQEADAYFAQRLHERTWYQSKAIDREKALWAATLIIDALNYKGDKHPVYEVLQSNSLAPNEEIRVAEASQFLEFPRDADMEVPEEIRVATYEIAYSLLDGKDPDIELEALGIKSYGFQGEAVSHNREQVPIEHIINGIPSTQAWRLLRPYLREDDAIVLSRI